MSIDMWIERSTWPETQVLVEFAAGSPNLHWSFATTAISYCWSSVTITKYVFPFALTLRTPLLAVDVQTEFRGASLQARWWRESL